MEGYCNKKGAADYLGLTVRAIEHKVAANQIPFFKMGKSVMFKYSLLDEWMETFRVKTNEELFQEAQSYK